MSKCPTCGKPITKLPSGKILHNDTGREICAEAVDKDQDHSDLLDTVRGVHH